MHAQADAVLGMALRRLTSLEAGKLEAEAAELAARIAELQVRCRLGGAVAGWGGAVLLQAVASSSAFYGCVWHLLRLPVAKSCLRSCRTPSAVHRLRQAEPFGQGIAEHGRITS